MTDPRLQPESRKDLRELIADLSSRLERVESHLGLEVAAKPVEDLANEKQAKPLSEKQIRADQESIEFEMGQTWFALLGIIVLSIGMAFLLTLPFGRLPAWLPSLAGYLVFGGVFILAKKLSGGFPEISKYLRGAAMLLLFFSTWRLFDFGVEPAVSRDSLVAVLVVVAATGINLTLSWRRASPVLFSIALATGMGGALVLRSDWSMLVGVTAMVLFAAWGQVKRSWRSVGPFAFMMAIAAYVAWVARIWNIDGEFLVQHNFQILTWAIPVWIVALALAVMHRPDISVEDTLVQVTALILCVFGFGTFMFHQLIAYPQFFILAQAVMTILLLGISVSFWMRERSRISTFLFAMTGYMALSTALLKAFDFPEVFVALSIQSLVVVATAIYFCSPFIIVANCLIFITIIMGYLVVAQVEQGMSIGFGVVSLVSARILNWQKKRLTLRTELMRNTYLLIAFCSFPYALYYLVPESYVAVAWVGLALFYYALHLIFGNRKYRWMAHATLLITALYVLVVGTARLESHYRILSYLILGSIMVIVSVVFTIIRSNRHKKGHDKEAS